MSKKKKCIGTWEIAKATSVEDVASYVLALPKGYDFTKKQEAEVSFFAKACLYSDTFVCKETEVFDMRVRRNLDVGVIRVR